MGLFLCGVAVALNRLGPANDFLEQLALAFSLTGQTLFTIGFFEIFDEVIPVAMLLIVLEVFLLVAYRDYLHRFISTLVIVGAILAIIADIDVLEILYGFIFGLGLVGVMVSWQQYRLWAKGWAEWIAPISSAVIVSFLGLLVLPQIDDLDLGLWWLTALLLLGLLLFLIVEIGRDLGFRPRDPILLALMLACIILFIPAMRMPGILGAIIVLLLGFWRSNRFLLGLAACFLVFYLGAYYYSLTWTLLMKSIVLIATGGILFLLRYALQYLTSFSE